jgi:hypothetical protein
MCLPAFIAPPVAGLLIAIVAALCARALPTITIGISFTFDREWYRRDDLQYSRIGCLIILAVLRRDYPVIQRRPARPALRCNCSSSLSPSPISRYHRAWCRAVTSGPWLPWRNFIC